MSLEPADTEELALIHRLLAEGKKWGEIGKELGSLSSNAAKAMWDSAWKSAEKFACGECGNETIASLDRYWGTCRGDVVGEGGELAFEPGGWTSIVWDGCEQMGWCCTSCGREVQIESLPPASNEDRKPLLDDLLKRMCIPVVG